jgi:hypothetical protein
MICAVIHLRKLVYVAQINFCSRYRVSKFPKFCQIGLARDSFHHDIQAELFEVESSTTDKVRDRIIHFIVSAMQQIMNNSHGL